MEWMLLPLKRYAQFSGRSRRMEYWMFVLLTALVGIAYYLLALMLIGGSAVALATGGAAGDADGAGLSQASGMALGGAMMVFTLLYLLISLALILPSLSVAVRRLHDTDRSGWWVLAPLAGYAVAGLGVAAQSMGLAMLGVTAGLILAIVLIVFMVLDGTPGPNRFGPDPKRREPGAPSDTQFPPAM